jgi:hypothetical protein
VGYCSAECQKAHWKEGGHKKQCKAAAPSTVDVITDLRRPTGSAHGSNIAGVSAVGLSSKRGPASKPSEKRSVVTSRTARATLDGGACIICLDPDPPPIQSGCACRGDAGLAHVECRILAASAMQQSNGEMKRWEMCSTCNHPFRGPMAVGLAEELLRRVQGNRERPNEWFFAASILSSAFNATGKYAEAEAVCREAMVSVDRMGISAATPSMTQLREHLGNALSNQGKVAKAQPIFERCLAELKQRLGPHHEKTLDTAISLGGNLACQGKHAEAVVVLKDTLDRAKRAHGPEHVTALRCGEKLANELNSLCKYDEARAMYHELLPVMKRVLGPDHTFVLTASSNYATALVNCGGFVEAEAMLEENVAAQMRVFGPHHPGTVHAARGLAVLRQLNGRQANG